MLTPSDCINCLMGAVLAIAAMLAVVYAADVEASSLGNPESYELTRNGG